MAHTPKLLRALLASLTAASLVVAAPGLGAYQAAAQTRGTGAAVEPVRLPAAPYGTAPALAPVLDVPGTMADVSLSPSSIMAPAPAAVTRADATAVRASAAAVPAAAPPAAADAAVPSALSSTDQGTPRAAAVSAREPASREPGPRTRTGSRALGAIASAFSFLRPGRAALRNADADLGQVYDNQRARGASAEAVDAAAAPRRASSGLAMPADVPRTVRAEPAAPSSGSSFRSRGWTTAILAVLLTPATALAGNGAGIGALELGAAFWRVLAGVGTVAALGLLIKYRHRIAQARDKYRATFNPSERMYILTQAIFLTGMTVYFMIMPLIVKAISAISSGGAGTTTETGTLRAVHYTTMIFAYLFSAQVVNKNPKGHVLGVTNMGRAIVFGAIGLLALTAMPWSLALPVLAVSVITIAAAGFLMKGPLRGARPLAVTLGVLVLGTVLAASIFSGFGLIGTLLPGVLPALGPMGGLTWEALIFLVGLNALVIGPYGILGMEGKGPNYVFDTQEKIEKASYLFNVMRAVIMLATLLVIGYPIDWLDSTYGVGTGAAAGSLLVAGLIGLTTYLYMSKIKFIRDEAEIKPNEGLRDLGRRLRDNVKVLFSSLLIPFGWPKALWTMARNGLIRGRLGSLFAVQFVLDALNFIFLPYVVLDLLGLKAADQGFALGMANVGTLLSSLFMGFLAQKIQNRIGLSRFMLALSVMTALAFVPTFFLWGTTSLLVASTVFLAASFLLEPLRQKMGPEFLAVLRTEPDAKKYSSEIMGIIQSFSMLSAAASSILFKWAIEKGNNQPGGFLYDWLGEDAALKFLTLVMGALGVITMLSYLTMRRYLAPLPTALRQAGHPYPKSSTVKDAAGDRPIAVVLGAPTAENIAIAAAGARQAPGDFHLVTDPSWIERRGGDLYLTRGLTFDAEGRPVLTTYREPRLIRAFDDRRPEAEKGAPAFPAVKAFAAGALATMLAASPVNPVLAAPERASEVRAGALVEQARLSALQGKAIVVVGFAVGSHHRAYLEAAQKLGVKVQLLYLKESSEAVDIFTRYNPTDIVENVITVEVPTVTGEGEQARAERIARLAAEAAEAAGVQREGVVSFVEEDIEIAAHLGARWGLPHGSAAAVRTLRNKDKMAQLLIDNGLPAPRTVAVKDAAELKAALAEVGYPAVLKPAAGSHAEGVIKVADEAEALEKFAALDAKLAREATVGGNMSFSRTVLVQTYLQPRADPPGEFDVDFMLDGAGNVVYAKITDNHANAPGSFAPTGLNSPSRHSTEDQQRIIDTVTSAAKAAGAYPMVGHFEGIMTEDGRVFGTDYNPRLGGRPVWPINRDVWGVDLLQESLLMAAGIPGRPYVSPVPLTHVYARIKLLDYTGTPRQVRVRVDGLEEVRRDPRVWLPATAPLNAPDAWLTISRLLMDRPYVLSTRGPTMEDAMAANAELAGRLNVVIVEERPAGSPGS